ncbi:type II secretion system protein GspC [Leclercia adecarboxylata]|uniref:type II secretion system protein GspC n=1 Tax=Leclercia adecarboxylata TaxID=83655 RepID=UPI002DBCF2AA|nr:type II secretion system protein GspC [Leclercia adecarboxylata]MEB6379142.1 type II secretion system protein GspC [Leclercia adecarboxylata]
MFILLIFSGQQGYVVLKEYKKVGDKLSEADPVSKMNPEQGQDFALFQPAVSQPAPQRTVQAPVNAEVEGIIRSDEAWMSFAVIKTPSGQQSYREGESLTGFPDTWVEEINRDNVVINYQGSHQTLAIKRPDYFKGDVNSAPTPAPQADPGSENLHLNDYLVLKPRFDNGHLEGYQIKPRNASSFFSQSGLKKGDVVVKVNTVDMTKEEQAKNIIASWSKMREAEFVVKRHAHLEHIRVNVLNN